MTWSATERAIFDDLRRDQKETREASITLVTLQKEHTKQLEKLFTKIDDHASQISTLTAQHDECFKRNNPGDRPSRMSAYAGVVSAVAALIATAVAVAALII